MNLLAAIFSKRAPATPAYFDLPMRSPVTGQFTPSPKELERLNKRASINGQLAVYKAVTTPEQRRADTEAFFERAKSA